MRSITLVTLLCAGLLSAAIATTLTLALAPRNAPEPTAPAISRGEWDALQAEVERVNAAASSAYAAMNRGPASEPTGSRVATPAENTTKPAPPPSTAALVRLRKMVQGQAEQIRQLKERVRSLERRALSVEPIPDSIEAIRKALTDKNLHGYGVSSELRSRRMELLERFLALAPTDPQAKRHFNQLFSDYIGTRQLQRNEALLEQMRGPLKFSKWELSSRRTTLASVRGNYAEARQLMSQTANDPGAPEHRRVRARFDIAHSYQRVGDYTRAIPLYQALIRSFPDPPPATVKDTVSGAKAMIEKIRRWQKQAQGRARK